jgi:hypothetical protein
MVTFKGNTVVVRGKPGYEYYLNADRATSQTGPFCEEVAKQRGSSLPSVFEAAWQLCKKYSVLIYVCGCTGRSIRCVRWIEAFVGPRNILLPRLSGTKVVSKARDSATKVLYKNAYE